MEFHPLDEGVMFFEGERIRVPEFPIKCSPNFEIEDDEIYKNLLELCSSSAPPIGQVGLNEISLDTLETLDQNEGLAPLHHAAIKRNSFMVDFLLNKGVDPNILDEKKQVTPLICAAAKGYLEIVTTLINKIRALKVTEGKRETDALLWAVRGQHEDVVNFLLDNDVSQDPIDEFSDTPIHAAANLGNTVILTSLLNSEEGKVKANSYRGSYHDAPLHLAASGKVHNSKRICQILLEELEEGLVNPNPLDHLNRTPLHFASLFGQEDIVNILIKHGAEEDAVDENGDTPLLLAASTPNNAIEICERLLESERGKQTLNQPNPVSNKMPLHVAASFGNAALVKKLIDYGAVASAVDRNEETPMFFAIRDSDNFLECLEVLIQEGKCDVNHQDKFGRTGLHKAALCGQPKAAEKLLLNGADFSIKSDRGDSGLSLLCCLIPDIKHILGRVFDKAVSMKTTKTIDTVEVDFNWILPYPIPSRETQLASAAQAEAANEEAFPTQPCSSREAAASLNDDQVSVTAVSRENVPPNSLEMVTICDSDNQLVHRNCPRTYESGNADHVDTGNDSFQPSNDKALPCHSSSSLAEASRLIDAQVPVTADSLAPHTETAKIMCLIDNNLACLLPHPLIQTVLKLKWQRVQSLFLPPLIFQLILAVFLSIYVQLLFTKNDSEHGIEDQKNMTFGQNETFDTDKPVPENNPILWTLFIVTIFMITVKLIIETVICVYKRELRVSPWISFAVLLIITFYTTPRSRHESEDFLPRSMTALGITLTWIELWNDLGRLPEVGLPIRVYCQVFKNFGKIWPHLCLLVGFVFSSPLLFSKNVELSNALVALFKVIRIMAGDVPMATDRKELLKLEDPLEEIVAYILLIAIYTLYVLMLAVVLWNILVGMAVSDIRGTTKNALENLLVKQTTVLGTFESLCEKRWVPDCIKSRSRLPELIECGCRVSEDICIRFDSDNHRKVLLFDCISSDCGLTKDLKEALSQIGKANRAAEQKREKRQCPEYKSESIRILENDVKEIKRMLNVLILRGQN